MSQFESSSMSSVDKDEEAQHQSFQIFQKLKENFIEINNNYSNLIDTQVVATTSSVTLLSSIFIHRNFASLSETLHSIMLKLINSSVMKHHPIKPMDSSKPLLASFDPKAFFQYHRQVDHYSKKYYKLKHVIQDLIDSNTITMESVNDKGNKFVPPPNQNLQIFTNYLPSHSTNVVELKKPDYVTVDDMCVEANNVVNLIEQSKPKPDPCITFDSREIIDAPNGPLYIIVKIKGKLS